MAEASVKKAMNGLVKKRGLYPLRRVQDKRGPHHTADGEYGGDRVQWRQFGEWLWCSGCLEEGKDLHPCPRRSLSCTPRSRLDVERYNCPAAKAFRSVWLWTRSITAVPLRPPSGILAPAAGRDPPR